MKSQFSKDLIKMKRPLLKLLYYLRGEQFPFWRTTKFLMKKEREEYLSSIG